MFVMTVSGLPVPLFPKNVVKCGPRWCKFLFVIIVCNCWPCAFVSWCWNVGCLALRSARRKTGMCVLLKVLFISVKGKCVLGREYVVHMIMGPCCVCILAERKCWNVWSVLNSCFMFDFMSIATPSCGWCGDCLDV